MTHFSHSPGYNNVCPICGEAYFDFEPDEGEGIDEL